ncbi:MAG TPA: branched-chain amino acid ABC transporter substrate-binding protein [Usitatibacteraceae bacterium]|jgi:branched-chain amino acid transport system substrate-binding protein|nr:branched-chain amino acid ABC transporter substrate-binding protein [Usitatibacteraceae bacterium]
MNRPTKLGIAVAVALGVAACGKEEPKPAPKVEAPAGITVTIAHAGPLTGSIAHLGKDDENGVALAVAQANDKKLSLGGKPVTFRMMSEDDQADPKTGTTVAQKLVDAKVAAVVGHLNSGVTIPASEIYNKAGIPVISGSATNPTLTERGLKGVFRTVGRDDQQGPAIAAYIATELKAKKVAIIDDKTAYGEGLANEVEKFLKGAKVSVVGRERTTDKETDFKAILTKIKAKNPDVIFHGGMDATGGPMLKQARELGIKSAFSFGDGACTNEMAKLAGAAAEGLICSQAGLPAEAASAEFKTAFNAKFGEIKQYAPYFYDATLAVIEAMKKANSADPAKFMPEMYNVSFTGATGKVEFDAKGDRKDAEITIFRLKDGNIKPLAVVKNGVSTPFAAAAAPAPAAAPAAAGAPTPPAAPTAAPASGEGKKK